MRKKTSVLIVTMSTLLLGCGGEAKRAAPDGANPAPSVAALPAPSSDAICVYRERKDPIMSGYLDQAGNAWVGELRPRDMAAMESKFPGPFDKRIATAVARPRVAAYRARVSDNCYDAARGTYHACTKIIAADVGAVRGFARAIEMPQAQALARQLCETKVRAIAESTVELSVDSLDLRCTVAEEAYCPPPPIPAAPPPKKN